MKVIIGYPPLENTRGYATLGQNRQFQYFKEPTYIYPVVPAQAATLLKKAGHQVIWLDAIAEGISRHNFLDIIRREKPDVIAFETKTPVVKQHWKIIEEIKGLIPECLPVRQAGTVPKVVLFGDHVTALPEESFQNSRVDFVLAGGDYDFLLLNLCNTINNLRLTCLPAGRVPYDLPLTQLEPGIYYRDNGQPKSNGSFRLNHDLNKLPFIDRELTKWQLYAYKNGNYKCTPGTYIMSGRDCWWGKCTFCSWSRFYPDFRARTPDNVLDEIGILIESYGVREIMDDTGCFPAGDWLKEFSKGMIKRGYNNKIYFDCNMRFGALSEEDLSLMKKANFRLLLFGLESANQNTLQKINKNVTPETIVNDCKAASRAGLFPHITIMFGYPWETYAEALKTLKLGKWLLSKGYAYTMQATVVIPYPGTLLFEECRKAGWLKTLDWDDYDMKQPVMRSSIPDNKIMGLAASMYKASFNPQFILRKIFSLRDVDDLKYSLRALKKVAGHIFDFKRAPLKERA